MLNFTMVKYMHIVYTLYQKRRNNEFYVRIRMPTPKFQKGNPGKPKGAKNKFTTLKDAFIGAFKDIGGQAALTQWMNEGIRYVDKRTGKVHILSIHNRKQEFFKMIASMLPKDVVLSGDPNNPLNINVGTIKGMIENATKPSLDAG